MDVNDGSSSDQAVDPFSTITINRQDFLAAIIDAVNNLFLETYESYTGRARITGLGDAKCLIIHFYTAEARDMCVNSTHSEFPDLQFHLYDPKQLRFDEDFRAIQVTDIPFFITKLQLQSFFKKFAAQREFIAVLSGLPANTKDIHLAPLVREYGAKAINIPLSLNSYKPKPWAYVTFNSQATMDAAMEQTIGFQGRTLRWGSSNNSKALCHRCGKLGCASTSYPLNQHCGHSRIRDPVAALKERFNIGQKPAQQRLQQNNFRSRSQSKSCDHSTSAQCSNSRSNRSNPHNHNNNTKPSSSDRSVSFSSSARAPLPDTNSFTALDAALNILNLLKNLQHDVARVESHILTLELNNQRLSAIEARLGINPPSTPVINSDTDRMEEDFFETTGTLIPHPNAPLPSGPKMSSLPISTPNNASSSVSASNPNPSLQDELNSVIND
ncbi:hypothetical protein RhiirB3_451241 [Rhizophagus irregularis]|nr:hypothetical protein RhiirB3_451241 [Rhizophagus irregularis]